MTDRTFNPESREDLQEAIGVMAQQVSLMYLERAETEIELRMERRSPLRSFDREDELLNRIERISFDLRNMESEIALRSRQLGELNKYQ